MLFSSEALQWVAFCAGAAGTALWATKKTWRGHPLEGYFWVASGVMWSSFALSNGYDGLAARELFSVSLCVAGIAKHFRRGGSPHSRQAQLCSGSPEPSCVGCAQSVWQQQGSGSAALQVSFHGERHHHD